MRRDGAQKLVGGDVVEVLCPREEAVEEMVRAVIGLAAFKETRSVSRYHRIPVTELHLFPKKSRKARSLGAQALTA
jgi:hypothetical protein